MPVQPATCCNVAVVDQWPQRAQERPRSAGSRAPAAPDPALSTLMLRLRTTAPNQEELQKPRPASLPKKQRPVCRLFLPRVRANPWPRALLREGERSLRLGPAPCSPSARSCNLQERETVAPHGCGSQEGARAHQSRLHHPHPCLRCRQQSGHLRAPPRPAR